MVGYALKQCQSSPCTSGHKILHKQLATHIHLRDGCNINRRTSNEHIQTYIDSKIFIMVRTKTTVKESIKAARQIRKNNLTVPTTGKVGKEASAASSPKPSIPSRSNPRKQTKPNRLSQAERLRRATLKEIKFSGNNPDVRALSYLPFRKLFIEIMHNQPGGQHKHVQRKAVKILQEVAEHYLSDLFETTQLAAQHAKRSTIKPADMTFARTARNDRLDRGGKRIETWVKEHARLTDDYRRGMRAAAAEKKAGELIKKAKQMTIKSKDEVSSVPLVKTAKDPSDEEEDVEANDMEDDEEDVEEEEEDVEEEEEDVEEEEEDVEEEEEEEDDVEEEEEEEDDVEEEEDEDVEDDDKEEEEEEDFDLDEEIGVKD